MSRGWIWLRPVCWVRGHVLIRYYGKPWWFCQRCYLTSKGGNLEPKP